MSKHDGPEASKDGAAAIDCGVQGQAGRGIDGGEQLAVMKGSLAMRCL